MKQKRINLDQYLSKYDKEIGSLAKDLRNMILEQVPDWMKLLNGKIFSTKSIISRDNFLIVEGT